MQDKNRAPRISPSLRHCQAGYVLVTTALTLATLLGFLGFLVDVGFLYSHKREAQIAADAAAQEAVLQMANGATTANAIAYAKSDSALNGFTNGSNGVTVTINIPPTSGSYMGTPGAAEAIVQQTVPTTLLKLLNISSGSIKARGVAYRGGSGGCIYALDATASDAFVASGSADVNTNCGLYVNSSSSKALSVSGSACIATPTVISIVGNYSNSSSCTLSPTPKTGQKAAADPLAYVAAPTVPAGCNSTSYKLSSGSATISPGTYCGGITVSSSATLYLNSGLYFLKGGGLTVSGGASIISNTGGVTFYNTQASSYAYKPVVISGGSSTNLQAPTSAATGGIYGVLIFQDRSISSSSQNTVSGGSGAVFTGALYFPTTPLVYSGGSTGSGEWTALIADTLTFSGDSSLGNDFSSYPGGSPILGTGSTFGE